jgi:hypothetical protein
MKERQWLWKSVTMRDYRTNDVLSATAALIGDRIQIP